MPASFKAGCGNSGNTAAISNIDGNALSMQVGVLSWPLIASQPLVMDLTVAWVLRGCTQQLRTIYNFSDTATFDYGPSNVTAYRGSVKFNIEVGGPTTAVTAE